MTRKALSLTVRVADSDRIRLFVWELRKVLETMRADQCPHRDQLERAIDRLVDGGDDEHEAVR